MKKTIATTALGLLASLSRPEANPLNTVKPSGEKNMQVSAARTVHEATYIPFTAASGRAEDVAALLSGAAATVRATEPGTLQWLALRIDSKEFAIIDFFADAEGRAAHFGGKVAAALQSAAPQAVAGGWEKGVVARVENSRVLSYALNGTSPERARLATRIEIRAREGKAGELAALLGGAGALIRAHEPETLLWYALQTDSDRFVIFDVFASDAGREAHFSGPVAAALKSRAQELVRGGWTEGVVANIRNSMVVSATW